MTVLCRPAVTVVAPCFDEEEVLPLFLSRVGGVLDSLGGASELALVDDGSSDLGRLYDRPAVPSTTISG
jgi:dolichol-phosphate mannosyltransferase